MNVITINALQKSQYSLANSLCSQTFTHLSHENFLFIGEHQNFAWNLSFSLLVLSVPYSLEFLSRSFLNSVSYFLDCNLIAPYLDMMQCYRLQSLEDNWGQVDMWNHNLWLGRMILWWSAKAGQWGWQLHALLEF